MKTKAPYSALVHILIICFGMLWASAQAAPPCEDDSNSCAGPHNPVMLDMNADGTPDTPLPERRAVPVLAAEHRRGHLVDGPLGLPLHRATEPRVMHPIAPPRRIEDRAQVIELRGDELRLRPEQRGVIEAALGVGEQGRGLFVAQR